MLSFLFAPKYTFCMWVGARLTQFAESEHDNVLIRFCIPTTVLSVYILVFHSVFTLGADPSGRAV
jgi:hypothetical protein